MSSQDDLVEKAHTAVHIGEAASNRGVIRENDDSAAAAAWERCAMDLKDHDEAVVKAWKEEIDTLLVFAGLFSAVLTAFNVQSYPLLQGQNATSYGTMVLLAQLSEQLSQSSSSVPAPVLYSKPSAHRDSFSIQSEQPPVSDIRLNALWFCALVCSLASASIGILVKQWLNQYTQDLASVSKRAARTRQYRRNSLRKWHVANIVLFLPVLLQSSLVLFLAGLLELLWSLNNTVAIATTVFVALLGAFQLVTTILPAFVPDCAYQSPQALGFLALVQLLTLPLRHLGVQLYTTTRLFGMSYQKSYENSSPFNRIYRLLGHRIHHLVHDFVNSQSVYNWLDRERRYVNAAESSLDKSLLVTADATFADDTFLDSVVRPCLQSMGADDALPIFFDIVAHCTHRTFYVWGADTVVERSIEPLVDMALDITIQARDTLQPLVSSDALLRLLQFLRTMRALTAHEAPQKLQRLSDVALSLLSDGRMGVRRLAFTLVGFVYRCTWHKTLLDRDGVHAIVGYLESVRKEDNVSEFIAALHLLFGSVCSERMTHSEFHASRADFRRASIEFRAFFETGVWRAVRLEDLLVQLSQIVPYMVRLTVEDTESVDVSIVPVLLRTLEDVETRWDTNVAEMAESPAVLYMIRSRLRGLIQQLAIFSVSPAVEESNVQRSTTSHEP